jgi:hypothetical protein
MKNELVLDNLKIVGLEELSQKESKNTDGGWFGPMGFGFRVFFHGDQTRSIFGTYEKGAMIPS